MIARVIKALAQAPAEIADGMGRVVTVAKRFMYWLWNGFKALPGVHRAGHATATVLGLYRLDRALTRREHARDLRLADTLELHGDPSIVAAGQNLRAAVEQAAARDSR